MRLRPARAVAALAALALAAGCGYSLRGTLPPHLETVAVPVFANRTSQPAVESVLTRAIAEAFSTSGRLRVARPEDADAILEGEVTGYEIVPIAYDQRANVTLYRLLVTLNLRFRDVRRQAVLFEQAGLQERADFAVRGSVARTISIEEGAVQRAAVEIARTIVSLAIERF